MEIAEGELLVLHDAVFPTFYGYGLTRQQLYGSNVILLQIESDEDEILLLAKKNIWPDLVHTKTYLKFKSLFPSVTIRNVSCAESNSVYNKEAFSITDPQDMVMFRLKYPVIRSDKHHTIRFLL